MVWIDPGTIVYGEHYQLLWGWCPPSWVLYCVMARARVDVQSHGAVAMACKYFLPSEQKKMDAAVFVDRAREMAAALEDREISFSGSRPSARRRAARLAGIQASFLHSLRYRPPKTIAADVYQRLCAAIERQAERQIGTLENEILAARARRLSADDRALREVETALATARAQIEEIRNE